MKCDKKRKDQLTAQKVEVGLVFQQMLSTEEAVEYMRINRVPFEVIQRVLDDPHSRRSESCWGTGNAIVSTLEEND